MTTLSIAHKEGHARMVRALEAYAKERTTPVTTTNPIHVRVAGHAGVWVLDGPAHVLTDDDMFEHPTLVLVHHAAEPGRFDVVEGSDVTPFTSVATESHAKGLGSAETATTDATVPPIAV